MIDAARELFEAAKAVFVPKGEHGPVIDTGNFENQPAPRPGQA